MHNIIQRRVDRICKKKMTRSHRPPKCAKWLLHKGLTGNEIIIYENKCSNKLLLPLMFKKAALPLLLTFLLHLTTINHCIYAQSSFQKLRISYKNNLLTIYAKDAALKKVFLKLADKTNIYFKFPVSLKKRITYEKSGISIREALRRLLKGLNYYIIYSGSSKKQDAISEVVVLTKAKKSRRLSSRERRVVRSIKSYKRQIESLKKKLAGIDENSRRGKRYLRRIRLLEDKIKRLERKL